jgi:hypothetical protein
MDISADGTFSLIADRLNHMIRKVELSTKLVSLLAGSNSGTNNGIGSNAQFNNPFAVSISVDSMFAIVGDTNNNMIRAIVISTSSVSTVAGSTSPGTSDGIGTNAQFNRPYGIDSTLSFLLVADSSTTLSPTTTTNDCCHYGDWNFPFAILL